MTGDIFTSNLWAARELADRVNREPFVPGLISTIFPWRERLLTTTVAYITTHNGQIGLVGSSPRGGVPEMHTPGGREARPIRIPHYSIADHINADEIQNALSHNNPESLRTITEERDQRIQEITPKLDLTVEHGRYGALTGKVYDKNGVELADMHDIMGQTAPSEVDLKFDSTTAGEMKQTLIDLNRTIKRALKADGLRMTGIVILGDAALLDNFRKAKDYVESHAFAGLAEALNQNTDRITWLNNITFIEFEPGDFGPSGANKFFGTGKGIAVPTGPGLDIFRTYYAPGDWLDTVNVRALPRYMREYRDPREKGIDLEFQTNFLAFVTRPEAIIPVDDGV